MTWGDEDRLHLVRETNTGAQQDGPDTPAPLQPSQAIR